MSNVEWIQLEDGTTFEEFRQRNLSVPGTVIKTYQGEYLIGDINQLAGVCDCCTEFTPDTIVLAYKVIWKRGD